MVNVKQADAIRDFRIAWETWREAQDKADAAFGRYFAKLTDGEPTNAAQAQRLSNEANYKSADLDAAAGKLWLLDIDPTTIVPDYAEF